MKRPAIRPPGRGVARLALLAGLLACGGDGGRAGSGRFVGTSAELPTGSTAIAGRGLVASYDLSTYEGEGLLRDTGPHRLHGRPTIRNPAPSPFGEAQVFERVEHRIKLPEHPAFDLDGPLTIAVRVRVDGAGLHQHIVACDDKWALWVTPDDRFRLGDTRGGGWSTAPGTVETGEWVALVAVLRATAGDALTPENVSIYVDGEPAASELHMRSETAQASGAWGPGELYLRDACYIGFESHQGNEAHRRMPFVGAIDELLIYERAWTDAEVEAFSADP